MEKTLQEKIQSVISKTGMTYKELARQLGVSLNNLYKWKGSSNPRNHKDFAKLTRGLDNLLENHQKSKTADPEVNYKKGKGEEEIQPLFVSIPLDQGEGGAPEPYVDNLAIPGSIITIKDKPALIAYRNNSPFIGNVDGLIIISDDSMSPFYKSGSLIAISKLRLIRILVAGKCYYIIDKNNDGVLRKIKMAEGGKAVEMISENEEKFPSYILNFEHILAIFRVEAVITKQ